MAATQQAELTSNGERIVAAADMLYKELRGGFTSLEIVTVGAALIGCAMAQLLDHLPAQHHQRALKWARKELRAVVACVDESLRTATIPHERVQ